MMLRRYRNASTPEEKPQVEKPVATTEKEAKKKETKKKGK